MKIKKKLNNKSWRYSGTLYGDTNIYMKDENGYFTITINNKNNCNRDCKYLLKNRVVAVFDIDKDWVCELPLKSEIKFDKNDNFLRTKQCKMIFG